MASFRTMFTTARSQVKWSRWQSGRHGEMGASNCTGNAQVEEKAQSLLAAPPSRPSSARLEFRSKLEEALLTYRAVDNECHCDPTNTDANQPETAVKMTQDEKFEECAHPWSCEPALAGIVSVMWPVITGVKRESRRSAASDESSSSDDEFVNHHEWFVKCVCHFVRWARAKYETDILAPWTRRRLQSFLPCKELAALACAYAIDPAHNEARRDFATHLLWRIPELRGLTRNNTVPVVGRIELAIERLLAWTHDLFKALDGIPDKSAESQRQADSVLAVLMSWVERASADPRLDDLRRRALEVRLVAECSTWNLLQWLLQSRYGGCGDRDRFIMTSKWFNETMNRMLLFGKLERKVIVFDVPGALLSSSLGNRAAKVHSYIAEFVRMEIILRRVTSKGHTLVAVCPVSLLRHLRKEYFDLIQSTDDPTAAERAPSASIDFQAIQNALKVLKAPFERWVLLTASQTAVAQAAKHGIKTLLIDTASGITNQDLDAADL